VKPVGTCCLVLHSHLPWLAGHGSWPVGEEWLYQAWSQSYLPVLSVLDRLAGEGRRDLLTLGITPVLAAQLDDPQTLATMHTWLGFWQVRAQGLAARRDVHLRALAGYEFARASSALSDFESRWRHGGTPVIRGLADAGAIELLGGPLTHPFQPLLHDRIARFALTTGLDDHVLRFGRRPAGIWAPECGYRPGLEEIYAGAGVERFCVDGPTLEEVGRSPAAGWTIGGTDVVAFGRDDELTYRVWSPDSGYPAGPYYRDFHTYDHASGFKPARITSPATPPEAKAPYEIERARAAAVEDADHFVDQVRSRLVELADRTDGPPLAVVAVDTELFGHWWHEGPLFLERVLRRLPEAGVRLATLGKAMEIGHVAGRADPGPGSWGEGKDYRTWQAEPVADLVALGERIQRDLLTAVDTPAAHDQHGLGARSSRGWQRDRDLDEMCREALLALASDWAFMVSNDSATDYARSRAYGHADRFDHPRAGQPPNHQRRPFPHLDARLL
jgi:1,4-alpha-glucan branching enzyme